MDVRQFEEANRLIAESEAALEEYRVASRACDSARKRAQVAMDRYQDLRNRAVALILPPNRLDSCWPSSDSETGK
jgi:hypothetical protein